jgi:hypothetical protein
MRSSVCRRLAAIAALSLWAGSCWAQWTELAIGDVRVSGFGTVGISHIDAPDGWGYRRDFSQASNSSGTRGDLDSRLGLQLNYAPNEQFELVGQAVATRRAQADPDSANIAWAFAAYRPNPDVTLRVGRVNLDAFLLSDHRDVGFSYDFARPPVEFYSQLPGSLDGADIARTWNFAGAQWRTKLFAGRTTTVAGQTELLDLQPVYGVMASREADGLIVRVSAVHARLSNGPAQEQPLLAALHQISTLPIPPVAAQAADLQSQLTLAGENATYLGLGAQYEHKAWLLSGEITRVTGQDAFDFTAGYASLGRRFGPVTVFGIASGIASAERPVATPAWGAALATAIGAAAAQQAQYLGATAADAVNGLGARQRTFSLGTRWDLNAQLALKAQWDFVRVHADGSALWADATLGPASAQVGTLELDFVF